MDMPSTPSDTRERQLADALEQLAATSEILQVIARSPSDAQPVFDTIAASALRLCGAQSANVLTLDGDQLRLRAAALQNRSAEENLRRIFPRAVDRSTAAGRAVLERDVAEVEDVFADGEYLHEAHAAAAGFRSALGVPLLRDGEPIGAIVVGRAEPGKVPAQQVGLLTTFARQAVIAIENMRMFRALEARTAELSRAVDELRALGEVGRAIGASLDLETVLRTIVAHATQLAGVEGGAIFEYDAEHEEFRLRATHGMPADLVEGLSAAPMPIGEGVIGRIAMDGAPVEIPDIADEAAYRSRVREILLRHGYRSLLAVPLLSEHRVLGGLVVNRVRPGRFVPGVVALLGNFATQSAVAIQNARLFREIEEKSRELEQASRHKSAFLASMSHELRTPLNAIIGFTRIVMRRTGEQIERKQYENLEKILASAQQLLSLINAVLDLAKIESGRIDVRASEVRLGELLEQCGRTVEPLLGSGVELCMDFDARLPELLVDEEKLRQIVLNLLGNAAKFTERGSIRVTARAAGAAMHILVTDTGPGIPADKLETIFEEFEQVDSTSARARAGTGLGLAIARRLARLMGGELDARSSLGEGSEFMLALPLRLPESGK